MVKIPDMPGGYRPGDVVGGYVLTERGHWVEVDNPRAAGLRQRRYLSSQVSTVRDPDKPSSELSGAEAQQAMRYAAAAAELAARRAAAEAAAQQTGYAPAADAPSSSGHGHTPPPPTQRGPGAPSSSSSAPTHGTPPAGGPTYGAPPAGGPAHGAPPAGGPTPGQPPQPTQGGSSTLRGCLSGCLALLVVLGVLAVIIIGVVRSVTSDSESQVTPSAELPRALTSAELGQLEVRTAEVWQRPYGTYYVFTLTGGPDVPYVSGTGEVTVVDEAGTSHAVTINIGIHRGEDRYLIGMFENDFEGDVVSFDSAFTDAFALDWYEDYDVSIEELALESRSDRPPMLTGTLRATGTVSDDAPLSVQVIAVVRDDDGTIRNIGDTYIPAPAPGTSEEISFSLWDLAAVSSDDDFTILLTPY